MSEQTLSTIAIWSYGITAVGFFAFGLRMAIGWHRSARAALLLGSTMATALWAASGMAIGMSWSPAAWVISNVADAIRYALWYLFIRNLLAGTTPTIGGGPSPPTLPPWLWGLVGMSLIASFVLSTGISNSAIPFVYASRAELGIRLGLSIFGLMLIEQLVRRAHSQDQWAIKPMWMALVGIFGFDLFFYADGMLFSRIDTDIWVARGIVNAMVIPFIAVATARNTGWTVELHLSREAVVQSTALLVSAGFLLAVAVAGYLVRYLGGAWGVALQIELVFAALLLVMLVATSGRFRAKLKVFVSKHFFSFRYNYREVWLRFTRTLATESSVQLVQERVIMALADLVESPAGMLWLEVGKSGYQPAARWNMPALKAEEPSDSEFAGFLKRSGWVIRLDDPPTNGPASDLALPSWLPQVKDAWLIVPLALGPDLLGFVVLVTPRTPMDVNWEVLDLLKTASSQAASYLGQLRATEALLEAQKFDAFNRMSAFVVHDLKNLVAQLSLMLKNAERHRNNPEFQRDMLTTVEHVVGRMNHLLLQLRTGTTPVENPRLVDLDPIVRRVCTAKSGEEPSIELILASGMITLGHEDRLEHVIGHLVQNALDATSNAGQVSVKLSQDGHFARVEVNDTGIGMTPEFVRDRLFKPFETTKKAGMGIGVYESSQYITGLGGKMVIDSTPQVGTRVQVLLPLASHAVGAATASREAA